MNEKDFRESVKRSLKLIPGSGEPITVTEAPLDKPAFVESLQTHADNMVKYGQTVRVRDTFCIDIADGLLVLKAALEKTETAPEDPAKLLVSILKKDVMGFLKRTVGIVPLSAAHDEAQIISTLDELCFEYSNLRNAHPHLPWADKEFEAAVINSTIATNQALNFLLPHQEDEARGISSARKRELLKQTANKLLNSFE